MLHAARASVHHRGPLTRPMLATPSYSRAIPLVRSPRALRMPAGRTAIRCTP